jgi:hypothetical protein
LNNIKKQLNKGLAIALIRGGFFVSFSLTFKRYLLYIPHYKRQQ